MQLPFLKEETVGFRTQVTFTGTECLIYLQEDIVNNDQLTSVVGNIVKTIGMFWFEVAGEMYELQVPVQIQFEFSERKSAKKKLRDDLPMMQYYVYCLKRGDAFVYDVNHVQDADDIRRFLNKIVENGNFPVTVSYGDTVNMTMKMFEAVGNNGLNTPMVSYEFLISELYRWKNDNQIPFRMKYTPQKPTDFQIIRSTKVPQVNSTFTGIIGEDISTQILSGIVRTRSGGNSIERESPLEKIIKY